MELRYTTSGSEQEDTSEIALYLADGPQECNAETRSAIQLILNIPPGEPQAAHDATYAFRKPATIYGLFPHKRISFGKQSWDEMFIGFFEVADDP